jgi:hypothetical protein
MKLITSLFLISSIINLMLMIQWDLRYKQGFMDGEFLGRHQAYQYANLKFEEIMENAQAAADRRVIESMQRRIQSLESYEEMQRQYAADGLGWTTGRSNSQ